MTENIKEHYENGYLVTLDWEKYNYYTVQVCTLEEDGVFFGYPIEKIEYSIRDKRKANSTFNKYVKKYCEGYNE